MAAKDPFSFPDLKSKIYDDKEKTDATSHPSTAFNREHLLGAWPCPGHLPLWLPVDTRSSTVAAPSADVAPA